MERRYDTIHIGSRIKACREELGLTQEELASRIGVSRSHIQRIEAGDNFTVTTLAALCNVLEVNPDYLFDDDGLLPEHLHRIANVLEGCTEAEMSAVADNAENYIRILRDDR